MKYKDKLISWYVNLYRAFHGHNEGLFTGDMENMTIKDLQERIVSYKNLIKEYGNYPDNIII